MIVIQMRNMYRNYLVVVVVVVCGTTRINCGLPRDVIEEAQLWKKGEVTFRVKQNVLLLSLEDKRLVNTVSTLYTAAVVDDTSRRSGKTKKTLMSC
jgi:hypothetical protein